VTKVEGKEGWTNGKPDCYTRISLSLLLLFRAETRAKLSSVALLRHQSHQNLSGSSGSSDDFSSTASRLSGSQPDGSCTLVCHRSLDHWASGPLLEKELRRLRYRYRASLSFYPPPSLFTQASQATYRFQPVSKRNKTGGNTFSS
jgi:hypothetical protein